MLDDLARADDAITVAQRILDHLRLPLSTASSEAADGELSQSEITASIGIALPGRNDEELSVEQLTSRADAAMYRAKGLGGGTYAVYQSGVDDGDSQHAAKKPRPK